MDVLTIASRYLRRRKKQIAYWWLDFSNAPLEHRFRAVYQDGNWAGASGQWPLSGPGSSLEKTEGVRRKTSAALEKLFPGKDCIRIVDAPCGDMTWMPTFLESLAQQFARVEYIGIDVVPELVSRHAELASPAANVEMKFMCLDVTTDAIPACDLFFCKDLVNHLSNRDIFRLLSNLQRTQCGYAMITSNRGCANTELKLRTPGASRLIDLQAPPFCLPTPVIDRGYLTFWKLPFAGFGTSDAISISSARSAETQSKGREIGTI